MRALGLVLRNDNAHAVGLGLLRIEATFEKGLDVYLQLSK